MHNRRQRRKLEKELGLLKEFKKLSDAGKKEIQKRKRDAGIQIHLKNVQEANHNLEMANAEREAKFIQSLIESGKSEEEVMRMIENNRRVQEKKDLKRAAKKK
ncbi:hypothetical protein EBU94_00360 [bacterium]|nr:hypothetical protein [bacterium]